MTISELIEELEKLKEEHGDVRVEIFSDEDRDGGEFDLDEIACRFHKSTPWSKDVIELFAVGHPS